MEISNIYLESINKITENSMSEDAIRLLSLLATTKASLSVSEISEFLNIEPANVQLLLDLSAELLFADPVSPCTYNYMLTHESCREYIEEHFSAECKIMKKKLSDKSFKRKEQAKSYIGIAFQWMKNRPWEDETRIDDALARLENLEAEEFYKAAVLLIWIEADRQIKLQEEDRKPDYVQKIINKINELPEGPEPVNWGNFFSVEFMYWWVEYINSVWPVTGLNKFELIILRSSNYKLKDLFDFQDELDLPLFAPVFKQLVDKNIESLSKSKKMAISAGILADNGEIENAKKELTSAVEIVIEILYKFDLRRTFIVLAHSFAKIGDLDFVSNMVDKMPYFHKNWLFIAISKEFAMAGDFKSAIKLSNNPDYSLYKSEMLKNISRAYVQKGDFESASEIAGNIERDVYKGKAYGNIAKEYFNSGNFDKAEELFKLAINIASNIKNDIDALIYISKILVSVGKTDRAIEVLKYSLKFINEITRDQGLLTQFEILPKIAEIFASAGDYESACYAADNFELKEDLRLLAYLFAYSNIITALAKRGDTEKAQEIFESVIIIQGDAV